MVASAFPLAEVALRAIDAQRAAEANVKAPTEGAVPGVDDLPFSGSEEGSSPPSPSGDGGLADPAGSSSLPGDASAASQHRASASGSVLVSQVLGAAEMMGHKGIEVPELPTAMVASEDPLRAAILTWIAVTGAIVPPDELARELARADALPIETQRDVALLLLSAAQATLMQREALALLTPEEIAWVYEHPEVGEQMLAGVESRETRYMAYLAGKIDMRHSVAASALLLEAVEATRGSLSKPAARDALATLAAGDVDETTAAMLQLLASVPEGASDREKIVLAARLVSLAGGFELPAAPEAPSFDDALAALLAQTSQAPDPAALADVKARAELLPLDLQQAIARLVMAEANAVRAANPAHLTPTSQSEALASMLVATAEALPVLEKYGMYWRGAPAALRVSEWDPAQRVGWVAHHAALFVTARSDITTLAMVAPMLSGHAMAAASVPQRSFTDAYLAIAKEAAFPVNESMLAELRAAEASLDPAVRDAAAILLSGTAESTRLQRLAFAHLTPDEERFLRSETDGLDALVASESPSDEDLDRLARATQLAARVDAEKLAQSAVVAARATADALEILEGRDAFATQSAATKVQTGLRGLFARFFPVQTAQAQTIPCILSPGFIVEACPQVDDTLLRIRYPIEFFGGRTPAENNAMAGVPSDPFWGPYHCNETECIIYAFSFEGLANPDILVITGTQSTTYRPAQTDRFVCPSVLDDQNYTPVVDFDSCRFEPAYRYGSANVRIDLGGDDVYQMPVGVVGINATLPVAIHLEVGGSDRYQDPSSLYDRLDPQSMDLGANAGSPSQASALYGGVAILVDAQGGDSYQAATRSQAYARLGFALLADVSGDTDTYTAAEWSQGAASETFTLGAAILFDRTGNEKYTARSGQGYGLGGVLLDVGGQDQYRNNDAALGVPVVQLDILPGGSIGTFDERRDDRVWIDGPGTVSIGLGIDQEAILSAGGSDSDAFADIIEFLVGTDPDDPADNPQTNPLGRVGALINDEGDFDGYPDYIERALSTDENDPSSYPAGFPSGVVVKVPAEVTNTIRQTSPFVYEFLGVEGGNVAPFEDMPTGGNLTSSDKIVDLRLPLQDAGSIDYACTGEFYPNMTSPMGQDPGQNVFGILESPLYPGEGDNGGAATEDGQVFQHCVFVSYASSSPGNGNATIPRNAQDQMGSRFTFELPAGILAIGDVVETEYVADYFVVIDLGGGDSFANSAGGALVVRTTPILGEGQEEGDSDVERVRNSFMAPSLVVNVDTREAADVLTVLTSNDSYVNASRDFAQGSYFGVLVDNVGADVYTARDGSQGALGGVLLDLDGNDTYRAGNLSQGASLASVSRGSEGLEPERPVEDLPEGGNLPTDSSGSLGDFGAHRRSIPGILLDLGGESAYSTANQSFTALSHSQGFARGYAGQTASQADAPAAYGILASLGSVAEEAFYGNGRFTQGVAGVDGVGLLLNAEGKDSYLARHLISQGATISQRVYTGEPTMNGAPHPALGLLVDLGGFTDSYKVSDPVNRVGEVRSGARQNNLTIQRSASWSAPSQDGELVAYADLGITLDVETDPTSPLFLAGLFGTNGAPPVSSAVDPESGQWLTEYVVYMPTARLAIGSEKMTRYTKDFAFVVDLGGTNYYNQSSAGFIRDVLVGTTPDGQVGGAPSGTGAASGAATYGLGLGLFPVTLVVDAGRSDSFYTASRAFTQGAGFFGVGVLADLGGEDVFVAKDAFGLNMSSAWVASPPIVDGNIGSDWDGVPVKKDLAMRSMEDARFETQGWEIRVANDAGSIYLAIKGRTSGEDEGTRRRDTLNVTFDMGRRQIGYDDSDDVSRTGADSIMLYYDQGTGACKAHDRHMGPDGTYVTEVGDALTNVRFSCRFTEAGEVYYEIAKPLVVQAQADDGDLAYCYDEATGFGLQLKDDARTCRSPMSEIGLYVEFSDAGAGYYEEGDDDEPLPARFSWPAGSADEDGEAGHAKTGDISDEMREWMAVGLAQLGADGVPPTNVLGASLSQGVGVAGVGVVALLGTEFGGSQLTAGDMSQAYGAFGGLGVVIDTAGSDTYVAGSKTLGAGDTRGFGLFLDIDGNDVYAPEGEALGHTVSNTDFGGQAAFFDLSGDDVYRWHPEDPTRLDQARGLRQPADTQAAPDFNNMGWTQGGAGAGLDYRIVDAVRQTIAGASLRTLYGDTRTVFNVTEFDPSQANGGPYGNGCTDRSLWPHSMSGVGPFADFRVRGKVCFVATVDTGNGDVRRNLAPVAAASPDPVKSLLTGTAMDTTVGGTINVSAVEFFVDRERVAATLANVALTETKSRWAAPVDLANATDGVARAKALPLFTAHLDQGYGSFLFYDDLADFNNETNATTAIRTLLIDNPPRPTVRLNCRPEGADACKPPEFTGIASATYSANAVGLGQLLYVNYTVDHDASEDVYAQHNGWRPQRDATNYPCRGVPAADADPQLCNTLPFYLGGRGDTLTTTPGADPVPGVDGIITESEGENSYFSASTHTFEHDLRILDNQSFRLALPTRTSLDPLNDQTTEVRLILYNGNTQVKNATGLWYLGRIFDEAPQLDAAGTVEDAQNEALAGAEEGCVEPAPCDDLDDTVPEGAVQSVYGAMQAQVQQRIATVNNAIDNAGNPVRFLTGTVFTASCSAWDNAQCRILTGRPFLGGAFEACAARTNQNGNVHDAAKLVDGATQSSPAGRKAICHDYYKEEVNTTADEADEVVGVATGAVGDQVGDVTDDVNEQLDQLGSENLQPGAERIDGINFTDIRFDANDPRTDVPVTAACNVYGCVRWENGAVVIPRGFRIGLEFGLVGTDSCIQNVCGEFGDAIVTANTTVDGVVDAAHAQSCENAQCVNLYNPAGLSNFHLFGQYNATMRDTNSETLRRLIGGAGVPASFFTVKTGLPNEQPRLEIRTPATPTTEVVVTIDDADTGETALTLRSGGAMAGDLPGTPTRVPGGPDACTPCYDLRYNEQYWKRANEYPHVNWTTALVDGDQVSVINGSAPRWSQGTLLLTGAELENGLYHVTVSARDGTQTTVVKRDTLLVDHVAPSTFVSTDQFAGKTTLVGSSIPVRWSVLEQGSGLREVHVYYRDGADGDLTQGWRPMEGNPYPPGVRSVLKTKSASIDDYLFVAVGVDRAGNVEGAPSDPEEPFATVLDAVEAGFRAKLALGEGLGYNRVTIDESNPRYSALRIVGGRAMSYLGSDFTFVRAGAPVRFEICANDAESDIQLVNVSLDQFDPVTRELRSATYTMKNEGACGEAGTLFVNESWSLVNTDKARFPEGIWIVQYEVFDKANNRIRVPGGQLILDHVSPTVTLEPPVLPTGQSAVKPGDLVKIRVVAEDDFGVDESGIRVDASKFAKNASALKTKSVRVNGVIYQEAQFVVDLPTLQNGVFEVVVSVPDLAGNATIAKTAIAVNFKPFEFVPGSLRVSNVTHNALTLHWKTDEPTSALAKFGTTSVALTGRTAQDLNVTTDHAFVVTGLSPSTHYFLRAVAVSAGGFTKESEIIEVDTASALFLRPISPVAGDKVSGVVPIRFEGGLRDSSDFVTYTLEVRESANASKPWTFLTTATRAGSEHELTWNSTRYLDGAAYTLRITAVSGVGATADRRVLEIGPITSDNTPPAVVVLSPLLATNDTTPTLVAEASDLLAGLAVVPAELLVDGKRVDGVVLTEAIPGGRLRVTHDFVAPIEAGIRTFELRVADKAGNVAKESWKVAIDGDAPAVKVEKTRYAPGTAAAKRGGTVTINLSITDLSGVALATADTTGLNPSVAATRLVKLLGTDLYQGTVVVTASDASAVVDVPIRVVDFAGNERTVALAVPVDNVAPIVSGSRVHSVGHRAATVNVSADEAILLNGTATAPGSPAVTAATVDAKRSSELVLAGLLPSRTYTYKLTAVDVAGNAYDLAGQFETLKDVVPPSAIGPLSVLDLLNGTLRLSWSAATDDVLVSHYKIYRSEDGVTFLPLAQTTTTTYEDAGLPYEKPYVYKVAAVDFGANEGLPSPSLRAAATAVPHLTVGAVTPTVGTTSTTFRYSVTYTSPGGVTPAYVRIILDGVPQNMTLESGTALTGAVYVYETRLAPHLRDAPHTYAFEASDGRYTVRFPDGADVLRGPLVSSGLAGEDDAAGLAGFAQRVPMGGVAGVAIALLVAVGLAAALRRKKEGSK